MDGAAWTNPKHQAIREGRMELARRLIAEQMPIGRPRKVDDAKIKRLRADGATLGDLANLFGVTRGAIQASLKR